MSSSCQLTFLGKLHRAPSKHRCKTILEMTFFRDNCYKIYDYSGCNIWHKWQKMDSSNSCKFNFSTCFFFWRNGWHYLQVCFKNILVMSFYRSCRILRNFKLCQLVQNSVKKNIQIKIFNTKFFLIV